MGKVFFIRVFIPVTIVFIAALFSYVPQDDDTRARGEIILLLLVAWAMSLGIGLGLVILNHFFKKLINSVWATMYSNDAVSAVGIIYGLWIFISLCIDKDNDLVFKNIVGLFILLNVAVIIFCRVRKIDTPKEG